MNIRFIISILGILLGGFMVLYGGYDDSPGGQLLGFVVLIVGILGVVKRLKK